MTRLLLLLRSLTHYWRWHTGLFLGVALTAAVISGSLITGDSVRATLARQSEIRLGKVTSVVLSRDGFFTESLAGRLASRSPAAGMVVPALLLTATVTEPDGSQRAAHVNLFGIPENFWQLGPETWTAPGKDAVISRPLAAALGIAGKAHGREIIVRFEKPSLLSRDAPLSGESDISVTQRLTVAAEVPDAAMGAFSLKAEQSPPLNLFLPLGALQEAAQLTGRANLLLCSGSADLTPPGLLTAADAGLEITPLPDAHAVRVGTSRIFLAAPTAETISAAYPASQGVLTYLVNAITKDPGGLTPYSMATATTPGTGGLPSDWPEGSVILHPWLADDLGAKAGDSIALRFFRVTNARNLEEATATFTVHSVLPHGHPALQRSWTPDFPGVSESENCRDWKPGIPIQQDLIRDKDDAFWREQRGTPKLFLRLNDGQKLWRNRFGDLTSLRIPDETDAAAVTARIGSRLTAATAGLQTVPVKAMAAQSVAQSMDFGALFLSMSAFLIATALLLSALLFTFGISQRAGQIGLLRATGWTGPRVQGLFVAEAAALALPAAAAGTAAGLAYARWTLHRLEREWADAALGLQFVPTIRPLSLLIAAAVTLLLALAVVTFVSRRIARAVPRDLLSAGPAALSSPSTPSSRRRFRLPPFAAAIAAAVMLAFSGKVPQVFAPMLFFGAGALLLTEGLRALGAVLSRMERGSSSGLPSLNALGLRNAVRRRGRSLALATLLATGVFMVTALHAFRQDARKAPSTRDSGTGGFAFVGESSLPIYEDLNTESGRQHWDFDPGELRGVHFVSLRVRDGEEASCLNLNRAQVPRILGVQPDALASLGAFTGGASVLDGSNPWERLARTSPPDGPIPAVMDQYSAMFALGKKLGDTLTVPDSKGQPVTLQLVALLNGSLLQGNVIIPDSVFIRLFPDTGGARLFLIDAPPESTEAFRRTAIDLLGPRGFTLTPAADRLAQFQAVQNTYLTIFSTLGGLALILAAAGLAVLVARHVLERRSEFAVLQSAGFTTAQLRRMILAEHWFLLVAGVMLGSTAALLAVWPNLRLAGSHGLPLRLLSTLLVAILAGGLLFCWTAARLALSHRLADALRHE
jgi:ABC-type antimicrobial peptide transport system permease subunit